MLHVMLIIGLCLEWTRQKRQTTQQVSFTQKLYIHKRLEAYNPPVSPFDTQRGYLYSSVASYSKDKYQMENSQKNDVNNHLNFWY